ncbi:MAG: flagellar biosynthesis anti-sigma factor FlgM [Pseudomonadales bacterium]|jgi:negative regulator of flagellin synthesis FlgM|nr:flagellar biosynthesis anti-sigma factor FlgM [Pseudomonadales bacterium]
MAIDINNRFGGLAQTNPNATERTREESKSPRSDAAGQQDTRAQDSVKISNDAAALKALEARLERQESFDDARVKEIRQAIEQGQYPIDNQRLAENFLKLESKL